MAKLCHVLAILSFTTIAACIIGEDSTGTTAGDLIISSSADCTLTQGYWKTHPSAWPVSSVELGSVTYSEAQALAIFGEPVHGNGLVALAHQLIAAKLNVAAGATNSVAADIAQADALIGSLVVPPIGAGALAPSTTSSLVATLDAFNSGSIGPGHCGDTSPPLCGNGTVEDGEQCDDGNTTSEDGCSSTCQVEPPPSPLCGNGVLEAGEECDDGNASNDDTCSDTCQILIFM